MTIADIAINIVATGFGAFSGAFFAFWFQTYNERKKTIKRQFAVGQRALFAMGMQLKILNNIRKNILPKLIDDQSGSINTDIYLINKDIPTVDIESILYLLDEEGENILMKIDNLNHDMLSLIMCIYARNQRQRKLTME